VEVAVEVLGLQTMGNQGKTATTYQGQYFNNSLEMVLLATGVVWVEQLLVFP
jgi:hypothetical protein